MKKTYKNGIGIALGTALCLSLALPANAQRGGGDDKNGSGGGGGGSAPRQQSAPPAQQPQRGGNNFGGGNSFGGGQQRGGNNQQQPQQQRTGTNSFSPRNGATNNNNTGIAPQRRFNAVPQTGPQRGVSSYNPGRYNVSPNRGGGYRSYPGLQFNRNRVTARPNGFYFRNRGYYQTYYRPQLGFRINVLPFGYYPFFFGADQYYYSDGLYYTQDGNDYTVVEPPVGATITKLPPKAQSIAINGMQYYELNGVYYQPVTKDDGTVVYQIAGKDGELTTEDNGSPQDDLPQVGDLVDNLPEGCRTLKLGGQKYYESPEGYYFQDAIDTNGDKVFKIAGTPTDEPGN